VKITHLQFADDALLVGNGDFDGILMIKAILRCFKLVSRLRINFSKSQLVGVAILEDRVKFFAKVLSCRISKVPFSYLGIPVGCNPRRFATWSSVIDKICSTRSSWMHLSLSFIGRVCLLNSILTSLPLFFMSFFKLPKLVQDKITSIERYFL